VNLLLDNNSVDWKKFGLYILKLNLDHEHYNPNVMKFDSNLIPKIIIIIEKYFDDMNIVVLKDIYYYKNYLIFIS